jgi:hypothetical protein
MVGCAPSGNAAPSQPQTPAVVDSKSTQVPPVDNDSIAKTKISSLESALANCQSNNLKLQKQIDQSASAVNTPAIKEPVSGDSGSYNMKSDKPGLQYPNKYLVWDIVDIDCAAWDRLKLNSALINNHPTLAITNVTINYDSIGSPGVNAKIDPGQTFTGTKNLPMPKVVDYQVTLRWVWQ